jgi:hypothetical protein
MEPLFQIKAELARRGKKIKELAIALGWEYGRVSRILNGFQFDADFDRQAKKVFAAWDAAPRSEKISGELCER